MSEDLQNKQYHTISHTRNIGANISKQKWTIGIRDLQKIGAQYVKRISERLERLFGAVRAGFSSSISGKQTIAETEQRIGNSKRTVATAEQCITDTGRTITRFIKQKHLTKQHDHQIER